MRIGLGNKITSFLGIRYVLLLQKHRNRNPRAIAFQKALVQDIEGNNQEYLNSLAHFNKLGFKKNASLIDLIGLIAAFHKNEAAEGDIISLLYRWSSTSRKPTAGQWLEISMYLLSMGCFKAAYKTRVLSYRNFDSLQNKLIYQLNYNDLLTALYFDSGQMDKSKNIVRSSSSSTYWPAFYSKSIDEVIRTNNPEFFDMINNKRVAVIGPLEFSKDYSNEIAGYDIVVELNALKSKRDTVRKKYHGKPDIIYYNNYRLAELKNIDYDDVIDKAKYAVIKTDKHLKKLSEKLPTRVLPSTTTLNWNGSFSMMENTVADLLLFNPTEIKIYGVNLYTSFNYDQSYGNKPPENINRITLNFTVHDIFTQYIFMNNLYNLGRITGDDEFEKVLQLGINGYVDLMSELYPKYLLNYSNKDN